MDANKLITIRTRVSAPIEKCWKYFTEPKHIKNWNNASDDWHTTAASIELRVGGKFSSRMEAKDGSFGFDFEGVYTKIVENETIEYVMADGRMVSTSFNKTPDGIMIKTDFEPESENPIELQRDGWQAILDNFGKYVESIN